MEIIPETEGTNTKASLELLYDVSREIATATDLSTLIQRVLFLSIRTIGASSGTIIVVDDYGNPVESAIIHGAHILDYSTDKLRATLERGLAGWVVRNRKAVLIPDTSRDERWLRRPDDEDTATGPKSAVTVPFITRDRLAGVITLVHKKTNFFTLDHLALIQAIADQSTIAVLNARLYADSLRQARIMTALAESATAITGSLHLPEVLQGILEQISNALRVEAVSLALIDAEQKTLEYLASTSNDEHNVVGKKIQVGQGVAGWVARNKQGAVVPNAYQDPRFYPGIDQTTGFKTKAIACAPILSHGEVIGILEAINPSSGGFDPDALSVLTGISSLAGTAIRHAQLFEDLQAAHKRYRDLFEDSINSMVITNWDGHIVEANRQTAVLSKFDKENLISSSINMLHNPNLKVLGQDFSFVSEGQALSYESVLHSQSGLEIPVMVYVQLVNIEGKSFLQWVFQNITERKELDQLRDDLLSMIYHDLRSPLANVVSSLDVMKTMVRLDEDPAVKSLFDIAVRSTERIERLTNSLLDISLLEADRPVFNIKPTETLTLIQDALNIVGPVAENKRQEIILHVPKELPIVMVNGDMIRRVLINLLENATKFSAPDETIHVRASIEDQWVQIWVEDAGPGVPPERWKTIFDKYTRLHGKSGPSGFGLGLAYCRLAVEGHGGKIWVENAPEAGARFIFTIPIFNPDEVIEE